MFFDAQEVCVIIVSDNLMCFYMPLLIYSESVKNAELMQRLSLVPKLLFVLHDDSVTDSTAHTIASVLSVLLSNTSERKNLLRYDTTQSVTTHRDCSCALLTTYYPRVRSLWENLQLIGEVSTARLRFEIFP